MSSIGRRLGDGSSRRTELLGVLVANALPVAGVLALDWTAVSLLLLYWFELGVDAFWALVRMVFAGRPPAIDDGAVLVGPLATRQPSLPIPRTDLRVYLATVASLPLTVPLVGVAWFFAGAVLVGPVPEPGADTIGSVTLATLAIFLTTGVTTVRTYFVDGEYRKHNARTAVGGLLFRIITVFVIGLLTITFVGAATTGPDAELSTVDPSAVGLPLLLITVGLKFTSDYLGVYRDRLAVYFSSYDPEYGWQQPPPEPTAVEDALDAAPYRVRPRRWGRVLGGALRLRYHPGIAVLGGMGLFGAALFAFGGQWSVVAVVAGLSLAGVGLLLSLDQLLRYGTVEYRASPEAGALVAYDWLLETALWRLEAGEERGLRVERTVLDALLGTTTITVEHGDGEYVLPHVADADALLAVFDCQPVASRRLLLGETLFG